MNYLAVGKGRAFTIFAIGTGGFIYLQDKLRCYHMLSRYATGNIHDMMANNPHQVPYFMRADLHKHLTPLFNKNFTGQHYIMSGETGSGKTRTVVEIVQHLMRTEGADKKGAPIYVHVSHGANFSDTLAAAVDFRFDEHISFSRFIQFLLQIRKLPGSSDHHRLERVLHAIEESAMRYVQKNSRPVVLVIDGIENLASSMPGALEKLHEKAALWADTNIVKVVLVSSRTHVENNLLDHSRLATQWSRSFTPVYIEDISEAEAITFLKVTPIDGKTDVCMSDDEAELIVQLVGGRMYQLIECKQAWIVGESFQDTASRLKETEREKFVGISRTSNGWKPVTVLQKSPGKQILLSKLIENTSAKDVDILFKKNIIKCIRKPNGIVAKFDSRLTMNVVDELYGTS